MSQDGDSAEWEDTRLEFYLRLPPAALRDITILPSVEAKYGSRLRMFQSCGVGSVHRRDGFEPLLALGIDSQLARCTGLGISTRGCTF